MALTIEKERPMDTTRITTTQTMTGRLGNAALRRQRTGIAAVFPDLPDVLEHLVLIKAVAEQATASFRASRKMVSDVA